MSEGSLFFEGRGAVQETLKRITRRLEELGIPYAVAGGMAMFQHGYRRYTEVVEILVTRTGLRRIDQELIGLEYVRPFGLSKYLRDHETKVKIGFLVTGDYSLKDNRKCVAFPDPPEAAETLNGMRVLKLVPLINLKLAGGMAGVIWNKNLVDVGELIRYLKLPLSLSDQLHEFVRDKYREIWRNINPPNKRYLLRKNLPALSLQPLTMDELLELPSLTDVELKAMRDAGVTIDPRSKLVEGYLYLMTNDPAVADRFGMHDESEFLDLDDTPPHS